MKYQVKQRVESKQWEVGDIVEVINQTSTPVPADVLVPYDGTDPNKHVLVIVEPAKLSGNTN